MTRKINRLVLIRLLTLGPVWLSDARNAGRPWSLLLTPRRLKGKPMTLQQFLSSTEDTPRKDLRQALAEALVQELPRS